MLSMRSTSPFLTSVRPGRSWLCQNSVKVYLVRLRCEQLFIELKNWEGDGEERMDRYWIQNGFHLAEKGSYNVAHPLSRRPVYDKEQ